MIDLKIQTLTKIKQNIISTSDQTIEPTTNFLRTLLVAVMFLGPRIPEQASETGLNESIPGKLAILKFSPLSRTVCRVNSRYTVFVSEHIPESPSMTTPSKPSNLSIKRAASKPSLLILVACLALPALSGCQRTVLKKDDPRSPFDRYNLTRAQHAPPFLEDEYGRRTPNLRQRLVKADE